MAASDIATPSSRFAEVTRAGELAGVLAGLGLASPVPVLVLVGGASGVLPAVAVALAGLFESLAPTLDALGVTVVDGGTDFGIMALMGRARRAAGARFPLLGVAARGTVAVPGLAASANASAGVPLDRNHTQVLLVPGADWGDESGWISDVAGVLAAGRPSLTLVAAGGRVTRMDIAASLRAGRPLVALAGSGGAADELAAWRQGAAPMSDPGLAPADPNRVEVVDLAGAAVALPDLLQRRLAA
jgi:hypothetical protein